MDAPEDQLATTTPPPQLPSSRQQQQPTGYTYPQSKRRYRRRKTQIREKPQEPETTAQLVLYQNPKRSYKQKRAVVNDFYDPSVTKSSAMVRAEEVRANLEAEFPSFAKVLVRSNVTVGFWMHLPMWFCKLYLPKNDTTVSVENEHGVEYIINYIAERTALSGGWKAFIGSNQLHEGDVLVFHLVKPLKFKVYIVRGDSSESVDGEPGVQNLGSNEKQIDSEDQDETESESSKKAKNEGLLPVDDLVENNDDKRLISIDSNKGQAENELISEDKDCGSESLQLIPSGVSILDFKDVKGIEEFSILVNGLSIDSEISDHCRTKYYELCRSQNSFLHENLLNSINNKLAAEIIIGTVNIAEAVKTSKLSSSYSDYAVWDKTLKGFELLGMNVGFLRARLDRIMNLAAESEKMVESECREIRLEQDRVSEEIKSIELKLQKLQEARENIDSEIEILKPDAERHEIMFYEVVNAPW